MRRPWTIILLVIAVFLVNAGRLFSYGSTLFTGMTVREEGSIDVVFCPREDCWGVFQALLNSSSSAQCALYTAAPEVLSLISKVPNSTILLHYKTYASLSKKYEFPSITPAYSDGIMHNKFCVLNESLVITGSWNPTEADSFRNNNNMLIIHSRTLASNYEEKIKEISLRLKFRYSPKVRHRILISGEAVENYFCPEDGCGRILLEKIQSARSDIYFMTFSFTDDSIGEALLKKVREGVNVHGIFDRQQLSNFSEYQKLLEAGADVYLDSNKYLMHHKVFIIDNTTVITGSFNPTLNGDKRNDENILIIESPRIASRYLDEFTTIKNAR